VTSTPKRKAHPAAADEDGPPSCQPARRRSPAEAHVLRYYERFRGCSSLATAAKAASDAEVCASLRRLFDGLGERVSLAECKQLRAFLVAYGVSRTFAGLSKEADCLLPVVAHLQATKANRGRPCDVVRDVEALADACVVAGFHRNVSFASKCWCMLGNPVPMFSSEAVAYLKHKGHNLSRSPPRYDEFYRAWYTEYEKEREQYVVAAAKHNAHSCESTFEVSKLEAQLGAEWFAMRGFDNKLLVEGGPLRSSK